MSDSPLKGLRVLDFSRVVSGPFCTQLLADMGADVIKVEPPGGDDTRHFGPPFVEGVSTYFLSNNRGKRSLVLDLKNEEASMVVGDLVRWAEVVVVNYRPGVADRLGVSYSHCKILNSRLVYANISGFGLRGQRQYSHLPGYDLILQGMGGMPSLTGPVEAGPSKMAGSIADILAGLHAYGAITTALFSLSRTGKGEFLDISMYDGQLASLMYHATAWLNAGVKTRRQGNAHESLCPYETLRAKDGFFNLACGNDAQFKRLCAALSLAHLLEDSRFTTNAKRVVHREDLLALLTPHFWDKSVGECVELLNQANVPAGPIQTVSEALEHPQVDARDMILDHAHRQLGVVRTVGSALGFARSSYATLPPPELGEHTVDILRTCFRYSDEKIEAFMSRGVVAGMRELRD